jgi:hypothetical protein
MRSLSCRTPGRGGGFGAAIDQIAAECDETPEKSGVSNHP